MSIVHQHAFDFFDEKRCLKCHEVKPLSEFVRDVRTRDGCGSYCLVCTKQYNADLYQANRESRIKHAHAYRLTNLDKVWAYDRFRSKANREQRRKADRIYRNANRDKIILRKRVYRDTNREAVRARNRAWHARNPGYSHKLYWRNPNRYREHSRRRLALKAAASIVPFTTEQLQAKCSYWGNRCWMCGGPQEAIDHVKPLSKGGPHVLANLRPACWSCNSSKHNTWPYPTHRRY